MGILYYLTLSLGLFVGCWVVLGGEVAQWTFLTLHLSCVAAVLLLYAREALRAHFADIQERQGSDPLH